jgi:hypothetical protein
MKENDGLRVKRMLADAVRCGFLGFIFRWDFAIFIFYFIFNILYIHYFLHNFQFMAWCFIL